MVVSIAALEKSKNGIGFNEKLIVHSKDDMKNFKELTTGSTVLMGRKTLLSIGRPLPNRTNIVLSKDEKFIEKMKIEWPDVIVLNNLETGKEIVEYLNKNYENSYIIGGGEIYALTIDFVDGLMLSEFHESAEANVFFPEFSSDNFIEVHRDSTFEKFDCVTYQRVFKMDEIDIKIETNKLLSAFIVGGLRSKEELDQAKYFANIAINFAAKMQLCNGSVKDKLNKILSASDELEKYTVKTE